MEFFSQEHNQFTNYYELYKDKIYSYIFYRTNKDVYLAEDLTSEVFLKAYQAFETYNESYAFSTWIYRIAQNTMIDHWRKNKGQEIQFDETYHDLPTKQEVHDAFDKNVDKERVHQLLPTLSSLQQDVILLKYLEDLETKEIAKRLDQTPANVRQALSRGVKKIKAQLIQILVIVSSLFL